LKRIAYPPTLHVQFCRNPPLPASRFLPHTPQGSIEPFPSLLINFVLDSFFFFFFFLSFQIFSIPSFLPVKFFSPSPSRLFLLVFSNFSPRHDKFSLPFPFPTNGLCTVIPSLDAFFFPPFGFPFVFFFFEKRLLANSFCGDFLPLVAGSPSTGSFDLPLSHLFRPVFSAVLFKEERLTLSLSSSCWCSSFLSVRNLFSFPFQPVSFPSSPPGYLSPPTRFFSFIDVCTSWIEFFTVTLTRFPLPFLFFSSLCPCFGPPSPFP